MVRGRGGGVTEETSVVIVVGRFCQASTSEEAKESKGDKKGITSSWTPSSFHSSIRRLCVLDPMFAGYPPYAYPILHGAYIPREVKIGRRASLLAQASIDDPAIPT